MNETVKRCKNCGIKAQFKCHRCKVTYYCGRQCQRDDWKRHKKSDCNKPESKSKESPVEIDSTTIVIHVEAGQGNGLGNKMRNHSFPNRSVAMGFIYSQFGNRSNTSPPLHSETCQLLGSWDMEFYCNTTSNKIENSTFWSTHGETLNAAGIFLGVKYPDGFTAYNNLRGDIFVIGKPSSSLPLSGSLVSDSLWGILNLIFEVMDLYGNQDKSPHSHLIEKVKKYRSLSWEPLAGRCNANIYATTIKDCNLWR